MANNVPGTTLVGVLGNDTLSGDAGDDSLSGLGGDDSLSGLSGNDTLDGGDGQDTLLGAGGHDLLRGVEGNDFLVGDDGNDTLDGGAGQDFLTGGQGNDSISGGAGADELEGGSDADTLLGGDANDDINGGSGADSISGDAGDDTLRGDDGDSSIDTIDGGDGNDWILGNGGADRLSGGAGDDTIIGYGGGATLLGGDGNDSITGLYGNQSLQGGAGNDTIDVGTGYDHHTVVGGAGGVGGTGSDLLRAHPYDDLLQRYELRLTYANEAGPVQVRLGGQAVAGTDTDTVDGFNLLIGSAFNDSLVGSNIGGVISDGNEIAPIESFAGGAGNDTIDGGASIDFVRYDLTGATGPVHLFLTSGTASGFDGHGGTDTFANVEGVIGTSFADWLIGGDDTTGGSFFSISGEQFFNGRGGNDTLDGESGFDWAMYTMATSGVFVDLGEDSANDGEGGVDTLFGIEGVIGSRFNDTLWGSFFGTGEVFEGGAGDDQIADAGDGTISFEHADQGGANVDLSQGTAQDGYGSTDTFTGIDHVVGTLLYDDTIIGDDGDNWLRGLGGFDVIDAGSGNDTLEGGAGGDTLYGRAGNDLLVSYLLSQANSDADYTDQLRGGDGNDTLKGGDGDYADGGSGNDFIELGQGGTLDYSGDPGGVYIELNDVSDDEDNGTATDGSGGTDTLRVQHVRLYGTGWDDEIYGNFALDTLLDWTYATSDEIYAGFGEDYVSGRTGNDSLYGEQDDDTLLGDAGDDYIEGGEHNDSLRGGDGQDTLYGGWEDNGDDVIFGDDGHDQLYGGAGGDTLDGGLGDDWLDGGDDDDTLAGGPGSDYFLPGEGGGFLYDSGEDFGYDTLDYSNLSGRVVVTLPSGVAPGDVQKPGPVFDYFQGGFSPEYVIGTAFNDAFFGNSGANRFQGRAGNDMFVGNGGIDLLDYFDFGGSRGIDLTLPDDVNDTVTATDNYGNTDTIIWSDGQYWVYGSPLADSITGTNIFATDTNGGVGGHDTVYGWYGSDTLRGLGGDDFLAGGSENDLLDGGAGDDRLYGESGDDTLKPGTGEDRVDGGNDFDIVDYADQSGPVTVNLATGSALKPGAITDLLTSVEGAIGSPFADRFFGDSGSNRFRGLGGNDTFEGSSGVDTLDYADTSLPNGVGVVVVLPTPAGTPGSAQDGHGGIDVIMPGAAEIVLGSPGPDLLTGADIGGDGIGLDTLFGNNGADTLIGLGGGDSLDGGSGNDSIDGGAGNDILIGGDGNDTLVSGSGLNVADGGAGTDVLRVPQARGAYVVLVSDEDSITLVSSGQDQIHITDVETVQFTDVSRSYEQLRAEAGSLLVGTEGVDTLTGFSGNDSVIGLTGADVLSGGAGNDTIVPGGGSDSVDGGAGSADLMQLPLARSQYAVTRDGLDLVFTRVDGAVRMRNVEFVQFSDGTFTAAQLEPSQNVVVTGTPDADTLQAGVGNDTVRGLAGDDLLLPGTGNDSIDGGTGIDVVSYSGLNTALVVNLTSGRVTKGTNEDTLAGVEGVVGGNGNDRFTGDSGPNRFNGGPGNDTFFASGGVDLLAFDDLNLPGNAVVTVLMAPAPGGLGLALDGRGGTDTLFFGAARQILGSSRADSITGSPLLVTGDDTYGHDTLWGGAGNDTLRGLSGDDSLDGGEGDDLLAPGDGADVAVGGDGSDTVQLAATRASYAVRRVGGDPAGDLLLSRTTGGTGSDVVRLVGIERIQFSDLTLTVGELEAAVEKTVVGSAGGDVLSGGDGNDSIDGGSGDDTVLGSKGSDSMRGGDDVDTVSYRNLTGGIRGNLGTGSVVKNDGGSDQVQGFEVLEGSGGSDTLTGSGGGQTLLLSLSGGVGNGSFVGALSGPTPGNDTLLGLGGADLIDGGSGSDSLAGGDGNDTLIPGSGNDTVDGGADIDLLQLSSRFADVSVTRPSGSPGVVLITHAGGTVRVSNVESVQFSDRTLAIADLELTIGEVRAGTAGNDTLLGTQGNDTLLGNDGDDVLNGGAGNDRIDGGPGLDLATWAGTSLPLVLDLQLGSASQGDANDTVVGVEAVFGGSAGDVLRGRDGVSFERGETLRGGGGDDTLNGGTGVDAAEFVGARADYTVIRIDATTIAVRDDNPGNGDEGSDRLENVERLVFADRMLSFGTRAEELARVAFVLWGPGIVSSGDLFAIGLNFYDNGGGGWTPNFEDLSRAALQYWRQDSDAQLAARLVANSGTTKTAADLLAIMAANGGSIFGRAAAVRDAAMDAGTSLAIEASGILTSGLVSSNFVDGNGQIFALLNGG